MENNYSSFSKIKYLSGIVLLVLSILFPLFKIEKLSTSIIISNRMIKESAAGRNMIIRSGEIIKDEINAVQKLMFASKNLLNEFIQQSYELNEEINKIFNDTLLDIESADSINTLYSNKLLKNENQIDSVNKIFNHQSDSLIDKINEFADISYKIEIKDVSRKEHLSLLLINLFLALVYIALIVIGVKQSLLLIRKNSS